MKTARRRGTRGFTLVELCVAMAVAAVLASQAMPAFLGLQRGMALSSIANSTVAMLQAARSEAMKHNTAAVIAPSVAGGWAGGWFAFVDRDRDGVFGSGDIVVATQPAPPPWLSISGSGTAKGSQPYLRFDGSGFPRTQAGAFGNLSFVLQRSDVPAADLPRNTRKLALTYTGRVRICTPKSAADANCTL